MLGYITDKTREWLMATWLVRTLPWRFFALIAFPLVPVGIFGGISAVTQQSLMAALTSALVFFVGMLCGAIAINKYEPDEK